ncbi:MAG: CoA transferase [Acidobacteriota bacterium]
MKGLRVLDLTRMLSGPYCTRILGDFGAEVLKIQTARTALGAESNKSTYFRTWNRNKRGICLNLDTPEAQELFLKLAAESDIVVENYSPRIMANWDLRYERLSKVNDSLVMLSLSAMGQSGPWANFVGFAPTFHALSGLSSLSSLADSGYGWINIGHAYGDTVAGLYGALAVLAALIRRGETGKGCHIDLSCYEALCTLAGPALMRKENTGTPDPVRSSFTLLGPFPDGCYPCSGDDDWCAITIRSDEEWARFCRITGDGELAKKKFAARSARHRNRVELDRRICAWTSNRTAESVERELQQAGIAAHKVLNAHDLARDPQLSARSFYTGIQHCIPGEWTFDRSAVWPYRCDHEAWHAAPALGEANHDVFVKRLGITEDRFRDYIDRGIIG